MMDEASTGTAEQVSRPSCRARRCVLCHRTKRIIAHGLCRYCYDRERQQRLRADPASLVEHADELSEGARVVVRAAAAYRKRTGKVPGVGELLSQMKGVSRGTVAASVFECIQRGAAQYGLVLTMKRSMVSRVLNSSTRREIIEDCRETSRET